MEMKFVQIITIFCEKFIFEGTKKVFKFFFSNLKIFSVVLVKVLNLISIDQNKNLNLFEEKKFQS